MTDALRSAIWQLYRHRWSALSCIACVGVAIAVVTSTVSILNGVLLQPLPFHEPDRLVMIRAENGAESRFNQQVSLIDFWDWSEDCKTMDMTAFVMGRFDIPHDAGFDRIFGLYVSNSFFDVLQIHPYLGIDFRDYELTGNRQQIMLGTSVWRKRFGARSDIVGNMIKVNSWDSYPNAGSLSYALTGLLPEGQRCLPSVSWIDSRGIGPDRLLEFVTPMRPDRIRLGRRRFRDVDVLGRLKPGVSIQEAQAEMEVICGRLAARFPADNKDWTVQLVPLDDYLFSSIRPFVFAAFVAAMLVLSIAMANVVHLLLVQYHHRQAEMAILAAVGATPWHLVRQAIIEFAFILVSGLVIGLTTGRILTTTLLTLAPQRLRWLPTTLSPSIVALVTFLVLACGAIVWWIALRRVMSPNLTTLLGASARTASGSERSMQTLRWMTQAQLVATYFLLVSAGLLWMRTRELARVDPGFKTKNRLTMTISLPQAKHEWNHNSVFCNDTIRRVRNIPGILNAGAILGLPMGNSALDGKLSAEGCPLIRHGDLPPAYVRVVTDDYFETMGIPLVHGRKFNATDAIGSIGNNRTAIVNNSLVERCWPGQDPIGRRFKPGDEVHWMEIVGVVGDVHSGGIDTGPSIDIYLPEKLFPQSSISLVVQTESEPLAVVSDVRTAILESDRDALISDVKTMDQVLLESQAERRFGLHLLSVLSAIGLVLAALGVVLTTSHSVACRDSELKIRIACGATPWDIIGLVVRQHATTVFASIVVGMLVAFAVTSSLRLPWEEFRFFRRLAVVIIPALLTATAIGACVVVAGKMAFATSGFSGSK